MSNRLVQYWVLRDGLISCGDFLQARQANNWYVLNLVAAWLLGYLTAINEAHDTSLGASIFHDTATLAAWTETWCHGHPLDQVYQGMGALIDELSKREGAKGDKAPIH